MSNSRILVVFPTRSRPSKFWYALNALMHYAADKFQIIYRVVIDDNDKSMNTPAVLDRLRTVDGLSFTLGESKSKIHAINRSMVDMHMNWDILVLLSDDMICQVAGWDNMLRAEMNSNFPDSDGVLFHWDGDGRTKIHANGTGLNTMCILGRKYYERFQTIYNPEYISLWCDNEFTEVADILGKQYRSQLVLFRHDHFSNNGTKPDDLMKKTQSFYSQDEQTYNRRKKKNFDL